MRQGRANKKPFLSFIIAILLCSLLQACGSGCVEADDFGYPKVDVFAKGKKVKGKEGKQYSQWVDSGYVLTDEKKLFVVSNAHDSAWSSWFGNGEDNLSAFFSSRPDIESTSCKCKYGKCCTPGRYFLQLVNRPCIFRQGMGLYGIAVNSPTAMNPNGSRNIIMNPTKQGSALFYMGPKDPNYTLLTGVYDSNELAGGIYRDLSGTGGYRLYFQILDRYYADNSGHFKVLLKKGATSPTPGPIAWVMEQVEDALKLASEEIFVRLVRDSQFALGLKAVLILYIIFYAVMFILGMVDISQKELLVRLFKLVIVIQLLTTQTSWQFFSGYMFDFFTDGLDQFIAIVSSTITGTDTALKGQGGPRIFDSFIHFFFSEATTIKIWSLLLYTWSGFMVIPIIYVSVFLFIIALIKAVIFFLLAKIAISLLIIISPIFITLMLFGSTKFMFDNWIKQMASYFIQPLLVFAALSMFAVIVVMQVQKVLGFGVCWHVFIRALNVNILSWWKPQLSLPCSTDGTKNVVSGCKENIIMPGYQDDPNPDNLNHICEPYTCNDVRYLDLPFLDPIKDATYISHMAGNPWPFGWAILIQACILILLTYLMLKFNNLVPGIARTIAGTPTNYANLGETAGTAYTNLKSIVGTTLKSAQFVAGKGLGVVGEGADAIVGRVARTGVGKRYRVGERYDNAKGKALNAGRSISKIMDTPDRVKGALDKARDWVATAGPTVKGIKLSPVQGLSAIFTKEGREGISTALWGGKDEHGNHIRGWLALKRISDIKDRAAKYDKDSNMPWAEQFELSSKKLEDWSKGTSDSKFKAQRKISNKFRAGAKRLGVRQLGLTQGLKDFRKGHKGVKKAGGRYKRDYEDLHFLSDGKEKDRQELEEMHRYLKEEHGITDKHERNRVIYEAYRDSDADRDWEDDD